MKVVLAGGLGTRLRPLTSVTNKHLLNVYDQPMIYYLDPDPGQRRITDIMIVTGGNSAGDFLRLLGNGKAFGLKHLNYTYQEGEGGIAEALSLVEHFSAGIGVPLCWVTILLRETSVTPSVLIEIRSVARDSLKKVPDPQRFGVPELDGRRVLRIEEKPEKPKSDYAVVGIYMYDGRVYDIIRTLKPSGRGELEITDVNNAYIARGEMSWEELEGWWTDAGTFESLLKASILVAETGANKV